MKGWVRVENSYGPWLLMVGLDTGCRKPDAAIRKGIVGGMDSILFFPIRLDARGQKRRSSRTSVF